MTAMPPFPAFTLDDFDPEYLVTLDELYHPAWAARKKYRMTLLRDAVKHFWPSGHPTRLIHLTGTNGKGSVAHYLSQGLRFAGATGSWTSPHVFDYAERIHLNGSKASHREICDVYRTHLEPYQCNLAAQSDGQGLSFAELGVLLALHLFEKHGVVWGVIEVGAGGRYTPQMGLDVVACVLTNVGHDHPRTLGEHLWQRALAKAGIARPEVPFFTSAAEPAIGYVMRTVEAMGAPCRDLTQADLQEFQAALPGQRPPHQWRNMGVAANLIRHFYPEQPLVTLLESMQAHLPARFWEVAPNVIADVAHNPDKIAALANQLKCHYPNRACHFLLGLTRQRDAASVFAPLRDLAASVTLTGASYAGRHPEELRSILAPLFPQITIEEHPKVAYEKLRQNIPADDLLVLTGSAYMIDQALNPNAYLKHMNASFGWRGSQTAAPSQGALCPPSPSSF